MYFILIYSNDSFLSLFHKFIKFALKKENLIVDTYHMTKSRQDVKYLHQLYDKMCLLLLRENKMEIAEACFKFLPTKAHGKTLKTAF